MTLIWDMMKLQQLPGNSWGLIKLLLSDHSLTLSFISTLILHTSTCWWRSWSHHHLKEFYWEQNSTTSLWCSVEKWLSVQPSTGSCWSNYNSSSDISLFPSCEGLFISNKVVVPHLTYVLLEQIKVLIHVFAGLWNINNVQMLSAAVFRDWIWLDLACLWSCV